MNSLATIRRDVNAEFKTHAGVKLDAGARQAVKHIFDETLKPFVRRAQKLHPPVDVWSIGVFKKFILNETRKIALDASGGASKGTLDGATVTAAAVKVMTKTQKVCEVMIKNGKLHLKIGSFHGEVCTDFLASKT